MQSNISESLAITTNWETTPSLRDQQQSNISESLAIITNWETTPSLWDLHQATDVEKDQL